MKLKMPGPNGIINLASDPDIALRAENKTAALAHETLSEALAPAAWLNRALARSLLHGISGALLRRWPGPWRHAGVGSGLCHVRHRPNHASAPAAPGNSSCLSSCSSERFRRRHDALQLQQRRPIVDPIHRRGASLVAL